MKSTSTRYALLAGLTLAASGCHGVVLGNMAALGITCCLFFGTLQLGRRANASPKAAPAVPAVTSHTIERGR